MNNYEFLNVVQQGQANRSDSAPAEANRTYPMLLDRVRTVIAEKHADDLAAVLGDASAESTLRTLILKYTTDFLSGEIFDSNNLVERIYQDMASFGILTPYLRDPAVEEVNINNYDHVEICYNSHTEFLLGDDAFPTPQDALDIVRRLVRMGGMLLDAQTPRVDSYIGDGTRISASIPPAIPKEISVIASIRKQTTALMPVEDYIASGAVSTDMMELITLLICNHVSIGVVGTTGSGKSTLQSILLNQYLLQNNDTNNRVFTIEDSRELRLAEFDAINQRPTRVVYTVTKNEPNPISMSDQVKSALRFHPQIIVPAEVRDGAAWEAVCAGQTGHTILTSFHAADTTSAYRRLASMCMMANVPLPYESILEECVQAWQIMILQSQHADNSRKMMQIFEATGVVDGKVVGNMLYEYQVQDFQYDANGNVVRVIGQHRHVGAISPKLYQHLFARGVQQEILDKYIAVPREV